MTQQDIMDFIQGFISRHGVFALIIAIVAIVIVSLVVKPIVKKVLNDKIKNATEGINTVIEKIAAINVIKETTTNEEEKEICDLKLNAYNKNLANYKKILAEKWYGDNLSDLCFLFIILFSFIGGAIQAYVRIGNFAYLSNLGFYGYVAAIVAGCELLYAAYEKFGLKNLYKALVEKING